MRSYMSIRGLQNNRFQSNHPTLCFKGPKILTLSLSALFFGGIVSNWVCVNTWVWAYVRVLIHYITSSLF